jgi:hypothetical protein
MLDHHKAYASGCAFSDVANIYISAFSIPEAVGLIIVIIWNKELLIGFEMCV